MFIIDCQIELDKKYHDIMILDVFLLYGKIKKYCYVRNINLYDLTEHEGFKLGFDNKKEAMLVLIACL